MAFTVTDNNGGLKDVEFEAYGRLLRQRGIDLGKSPRVPEPGTGRRWLYVWDNCEKAEAFAEELRKRTHRDDWTVVELTAPPSEGPIGPIIVQVGRRSTGLVFALHPLSQMIIRSAFPSVGEGSTTVAINFETSQDFKARFGSIGELARQMLPTLAGLKLQEIDRLGYVLIEDGTHRTLGFVKPGELGKDEVAGSTHKMNAI